MLKRCIAFICAFVVSLFLVGCVSKPKVPDISTAIDSKAVVKSGSESYNCIINYVSPTTASIQFNSPETIKGMTVRRADGKYSLSLGSLICRTDTPIIEGDSVPMTVIELLDSISGGQNMKFKAVNDGIFEFEKKNGSNDLSVFTDSDGNITEIKTPKISISTVK